MGGDDLRPLPLIGSAEYERLFIEQHRVAAAAAFALIRIGLRLGLVPQVLAIVILAVMAWLRLAIVMR